MRPCSVFPPLPPNLVSPQMPTAWAVLCSPAPSCAEGGGIAVTLTSLIIALGKAKCQNVTVPDVAERGVPDRREQRLSPGLPWLTASRNLCIITE